MKRILIATDGSPHAKEACAFGLEFAEHEGAEVVLVHVLSALDPVEQVEGHLGVPHRIAAPDADAALRDTAAAAEARGVSVRVELLVGLPEDEVVALAKEVDADLIVVGSRGLGTLKGALLGSVSRGVLANADRPVLVVKSVPVHAERAAGS